MGLESIKGCGLMNKEEYQKWIEELESRGLEDFEIEEIINDCLDQPESPDWFFRDGDL